MDQYNGHQLPFEFNHNHEYEHTTYPGAYSVTDATPPHSSYTVRSSAPDVEPFKTVLTCSSKDLARFWSKVKVTDSCWLWLAGTFTNGYGRFFLNGKEELAHRVSYQLYNECLLTPDQLVCHSCDNKPCVSPFHLHEGDKRSNALEAISRGLWGERDTSGEHNGRAKLTWEIVELIRTRYTTGDATQQELALEYGVNQTVISDAVRGVTW